MGDPIEGQGSLKARSGVIGPDMTKAGTPSLRRSPWSGRNRSASASMGVALFPRDGKNFSELYARADAALYRAKLIGKDRFVFFEADPPA